MKPEEVATIAVRLLGLLIAILMLESAFSVAVSITSDIVTSSGRWFPPPLMDLFVAVGRLAPLALGLYMFLSGKWFIRRIVRGLGPPPEGICPACNYDLAGLRVSRCPECGEKLPKGVIRATEVAGKEHRSQKGPPRTS